MNLWSILCNILDNVSVPIFLLEPSFLPPLYPSALGCCNPVVGLPYHPEDSNEVFQNSISPASALSSSLSIIALNSASLEGVFPQVPRDLGCWLVFKGRPLKCWLEAWSVAVASQIKNLCSRGYRLWCQPQKCLILTIFSYFHSIQTPVQHLHGQQNQALSYLPDFISSSSLFTLLQAYWPSCCSSTSQGGSCLMIFTLAVISTWNFLPPDLCFISSFSSLISSQ